jgi:hypothetical protein
LEQELISVGPEPGHDEFLDPPAVLGSTESEAIVPSHCPEAIATVLGIEVLCLDVRCTDRFVVVHVDTVIGQQMVCRFEATNRVAPVFDELVGGHLGGLAAENVVVVHDEIVSETGSEIIPLELVDTSDHLECEIDDSHSIK